MIILSLPYRGKASLTHSPDADLIEYRLDYCAQPHSIDFMSFSANTIITCRGLSVQSELWQKMLDSQAIVDVDMADLELFEAKLYQHKLIVSLHLGCFDESRICSLLALPLQCYARKIVFAAHSFRDMVAAQKLIENSGCSRVIFNVCGKWAAFQRSLYSFFSSWAVYLCKDECTYPGQLSLEGFRLIHQDEIVSSACVYGIIGGEQVNQSFSLQAYNQHFKAQRLNAHFLPLPLLDPDEAITVLNWLNQRFILAGFAITSPFKQSLPLALGLGNIIINSLVFSAVAREGFRYIPELQLFAQWANTDLDALHECLRELAVESSERIFIYGSGACAEAFVKELLGLGYTQLFIGSRNNAHLQRIRAEYALSPSQPEQVELLINVSAAFDFDDEPGRILPLFSKLIELPYVLGHESSLERVCKTRNLLHLCGYDFFLKQHKEQRKQFFQA